MIYTSRFHSASSSGSSSFGCVSLTSFVLLLIYLTHVASPSAYLLFGVPVFLGCGLLVLICGSLHFNTPGPPRGRYAHCLFRGGAVNGEICAAHCSPSFGRSFGRVFMQVAVIYYSFLVTRGIPIVLVGIYSYLSHFTSLSSRYPGSLVCVPRMRLIPFVFRTGFCLDCSSSFFCSSSG